MGNWEKLHREKRYLSHVGRICRILRDGEGLSRNARVQPGRDAVGRDVTPAGVEEGLEGQCEAIQAWTPHQDGWQSLHAAQSRNSILRRTVLCAGEE